MPLVILGMISFPGQQFTGLVVIFEVKSLIVKVVEKKEEILENECDLGLSF